MNLNQNPIVNFKTFLFKSVFFKFSLLDFIKNKFIYVLQIMA